MSFSHKIYYIIYNGTKTIITIFGKQKKMNKKTELFVERNRERQTEKQMKNASKCAARFMIS